MKEQSSGLRLMAILAQNRITRLYYPKSSLWQNKMVFETFFGVKCFSQFTRRNCLVHQHFWEIFCPDFCFLYLVSLIGLTCVRPLYVFSKIVISLHGAVLRIAIIKVIMFLRTSLNIHILIFKQCKKLFRVKRRKTK